MTTDLHALVAAYALDALDDDERAAFEAHLSSCPTCPAELAGFTEVVGELGDAASVEAPDDVRDRVLARLGDVEQVSAGSNDRVPESHVAPTETGTPGGPAAPAAPVVDLAERRSRRLSVANMLTAAAAAVLLLIGAIVISGSGSSEFDDVASASDAIVARLAGDRGAVDVAYSAELDRVALRAEDVDDLEPGLRYALWAIADGTPIPAGLFEPDDGEIDDVAELADVDAEAWGITVEPDTGSDAPTGEIIYYAET
jgi:anti-sigma factor RsiW